MGVEEEEESQSQSPVFIEQMTAKPQRPASLSLTPVTVKNIEGVSIDTPSNGILSFNTLLEGRTGLTPTNILTPTSLRASVKASSSLNTPNCSAQQSQNTRQYFSQPAFLYQDCTRIILYNYLPW